MAASFSDASNHQKRDSWFGLQGAPSLLGFAYWEDITSYPFCTLSPYNSSLRGLITESAGEVGLMRLQEPQLSKTHLFNCLLRPKIPLAWKHHIGHK